MPPSHGNVAVTSQQQQMAQQMPQQTVMNNRDPKMSPLNISSNPSYAEALAFSSGNTSGGPVMIQNGSGPVAGQAGQFRPVSGPQGPGGHPGHPNHPGGPYHRFAGGPPPEYNNVAAQR
ncbi:hypothetical protein BIW11_10876 [Tropilaelaps mercedesae]|uniref:Uncharacterized protein n=1 Tax=Tropilaelaps mercedesae TaxID=418985 RepID=A0A1V9XDL9_9ACAR|nr:hypothetical protein BIW11_10876 [Tropilaelaps mercedesae]